MSSMDAWSSVIKAGGGGRNSSLGLNYPTPFLNYEKYIIPNSVKELFNFAAWCFISDNNVKPVIENMSSYPVTTLLFDAVHEVKDRAEMSKLQKMWDDVLDTKLDIRVFSVLLGLDYFGLGNAFASVYRPFNRFLVCQKCGTPHNIKLKDTKWRWNDYSFELQCNNTKCNSTTKAKVKDVYDTNEAAIDDVNFIRWNPNYIDIEKNEITGRKQVKYRLTPKQKMAITKGDPEYLIYCNIEFIEAVVMNSKDGTPCVINLKADEVFIMQRAGISMPNEEWSGWGIPAMIASLRDIFFKNGMRRAQAMVLHEHTIPLRIFTPLTDPSSNGAAMGTGVWKNEIMTGYNKWLKDPTTIITSPVGLNVQQLGGDRGALNLFAETNAVNGDIIKGFGTPREFVEGALSYSGGNVSIRMIENLLMDYVNKLNRFANWVIPKVRPIVKLAEVRARYKPFKMADDIQQKQLLFSARQAKEISHNQFCQMMDLDSETELELIAKENMDVAFNNALAQTKAALSMQRLNEYNARINNSITTDYDNIVPPEIVGKYAEMISHKPPEEQMQVLESLKKQQPVLASLVASRLDLSPAGLEDSLKTIMMTPEPYRQKALQDLMTNNPTAAQLFNMMLATQNGQKPPAPPNGFAGFTGQDPNKGGMPQPVKTNHIKPNPEQKPPRSMYKGM